MIKFCRKILILNTSSPKIAPARVAQMINFWRTTLLLNAKRFKFAAHCFGGGFPCSLPHHCPLSLISGSFWWMFYLEDAGSSISSYRCCRIWRCGQLAKIGKGFSNLDAWNERVNREEIRGGEIWNAIRSPGPHYPSYRSAASMRSVPLRQVTSRAAPLNV